MTLPTPYTVLREAWSPTADAHGNEADGWAAPVSVAVHGWSPPSADVEPFEPGRDPVERDLDVYAPAGTVGGPRDRWTVGGVAYDAVGYPEDFSHGPWDWAAGVRVSLKRAEG